MGKMVGADTSFCSVLTYRLQASYFSLSILLKKKKIEVEENTRCSMPWHSPTRNLPTQIKKIDH